MPVYTYRCPAGHEWDEVRQIEGSQTSADPCRTCMAKLSETARTFAELDPDTWARDWGGKKVPSATARPRVKGGTPIHYPNRGTR
jgi:hypothetical protein